MSVRWEGQLQVVWPEQQWDSGTTFLQRGEDFSCQATEAELQGSLVGEVHKVLVSVFTAILSASVDILGIYMKGMTMPSSCPL